MIQISQAVADSRNRVGFFEDAKRMVRVKRARGESGVALVEFALLLPFLALLVFGTIDVGRVYRLQSRVKNASREGAAFAQGHLNPMPVDCTSKIPPQEDIVSRVKGEDADLPSAPGFQITVTNVTQGKTLTLCNDSSTLPGDRIKVAVKADFTPITPIVSAFMGSLVTVTGNTEMVAQGK